MRDWPVPTPTCCPSEPEQPGRVRGGTGASRAAGHRPAVRHALASARDGEPLALRAATLATAAAASVPLDRHVVAALNGDQISRDPELPLAAGDVLAFLSADAGG